MPKKAAVIILAVSDKSEELNNQPILASQIFLKGKPMLYYSLQACSESFVKEIVVIVNQEEIAGCQEHIIDAYNFHKVTAVVPSENDRHTSVLKGLSYIKDCDIVVIHDSLRPMVNKELIEAVVLGAEKWGACSAGLPVKDTIKIADENKAAIDTPPRKFHWSLQTPQGFSFTLIQKAHQALDKAGDRKLVNQYLDAAIVVELFAGYSVHLIEGSYSNIRVTTVGDLLTAEAFMELEHMEPQIS